MATNLYEELGLPDPPNAPPPAKKKSSNTIGSTPRRKAKDVKNKLKKIKSSLSLSRDSDRRQGKKDKGKKDSDTESEKMVEYFHGNIWTTLLVVNVLISYLTNGLMLCLMRMPTRHDMGLYKNILVVLGIINLCAQTLKLFTTAVVITRGRGFLFVSNSLVLHEYPDIAFWSMIICLSLLKACIVMMILHFIYRYLVICRNSFIMRRSHTSMRLSLIVISGMVIVVSLTVYRNTLAVSDELKEYVKGPLEEYFNISHSDYGAVGGNYDAVLIDGSSHDNRKTYIFLTYISFLTTACIGTAIVCSWMIIRKLREAVLLSAATERMQVNLFVSLVLQGCLPIIFQLTPILITVICPIFEINISGFPLPTICAIHPMLEPIIVIYFLKDHRNALKDMFSSRSSSRVNDVKKHIPNSILTTSY